MSAPRSNGRSARRMCVSSGQARWWICWSMRCWIAGPSPWLHRLTTSRNRKRCGATEPRSTAWPVRISTPRSGSSTPSCVSSPPPESRRAPSTHSGGSCFAGDGGEQNGPGCRAGFAGPADVHLGVHGCSSRSPRPAPGKQQPCAPSHWPGPKTAARCSASPRPRPRPLSLASNRHPLRHPRQAHLVFAARRPA